MKHLSINPLRINIMCCGGGGGGGGGGGVNILNRVSVCCFYSNPHDWCSINYS